MQKRGGRSNKAGKTQSGSSVDKPQGTTGGTSKELANLTRDQSLMAVARIYYPNGSGLNEKTYFFNLATGLFFLDPRATAKPKPGIVAPLAAEDVVNDVRRIVIFYTDQRRNKEQELFILDLSPGTTLQVAKGWKEIRLDGKILCPLNTTNQVAVKWRMKSELVNGSPWPMHDTFDIRDTPLLAKRGGVVDYLKDLLERDPQSIPSFSQEAGFNSSLLKAVTGLSIPEYMPPDCLNVNGSPRLKTTIEFPKLSEIAFHSSEAASSAHVIAFNMTVGDHSNCDGNHGDSGKIRTFWADDKERFEYNSGEAAQAWNFRFRPRSETMLSAPGRDFLRGARWVLHVSGVPTSVVVRSWHKLVIPYHGALRNTQGSKAVSFLPIFDGFDAPSNTEKVGWWTITYELIEGPSTNNTVYLEGSSIDDPNRTAVRPLGLRFNEKTQTPKIAGARIPLVLTTNGAPLSGIEFTLQAADLKTIQREAENPKKQGIVFDLAAPGLTAAPSTVRVGALDLEFGSSSATGGGMKSLRVAPAGTSIVVDTDLQFQIKSINPGGQDYPSSEEFAANTENREVSDCIVTKPPVVIPLSNGQPNSRLLLNARQEYGLNPVQPQQLTLDIISQTPNSYGVQSDACRDSDRLVVVLDRNPFIVAEVRFSAFDRVSSYSGSRVATWSSGKGATRWDLLFEEKPFCLVLPPQAVGEEMVKSKMAQQPIGPGALPFRFGTKTELVVDPRTVRKNYAEAPWNLRRILGTRGEELAGPQVIRLHYELLYGLTGDAKNPGIRLADVLSQVGRIPALSNQEMSWPATRAQVNAYEDSRKDWSVMYARYMARAAVLVPWNSVLLDPDRPPIILSESLSMRLRLPPLSNMKSPVDLEGTAADGTLRGGATWGFESKNIYKAVLENQPSSSARLENFAFSALGGWGKQQANFQGNLRRISAEVAMGRTYRYTVENLGRIGCHWNVARHVIVYERSVVPSRQFYDPDQPLEGWPVLRKVHEYIEPLDPKHIFSDEGHITDRDASKQATGFVTNCSFPPGVPIYVDSSWGSDVGDYGWKVPLWRPGASPTDVYKRPTVSLGLATNLRSEQNDCQTEIDNPENLYFFTLTRDPTKPGFVNPDPDPRKWPAICDVDYVDAPRPIREEVIRDHGAEGELAAFVDGDPRASTPGDSPVAPLYGPCTFRLKPAAIPTDIVAERAEKPMATVVRTVTLVRSVAKNRELPADIKPFTDLELSITRLFSTVLKVLPLDSSPLQSDVAAIRDKISNDFAAVEDKFTQAKAKIDALKASLMAKITDAEGSTFDRLFANFDKDSTDRGAIFRSYLDELNARVKAFPEGTPATPFDKEAARRILLDYQHQIEELFLLVKSLPGAVPELLARYVDLIVGFADRIDTSLKKADETLAAGQASVAQVRKNLTADVQAVRDAIGSFASVGLSRPLPFLPDPTDHVREALQNYIDSKSFEDAVGRLMNDLLQAADVAAARAAIQQFRQSPFFLALSDKAKLRDFISGAFGEEVDFGAPDAAEQLRKAIHFAQVWRDNTLTKWVAKVRAEAQNIQNDKKQLEGAANELVNWLTSTDAKVTGLKKELSALKAEIDMRIQKAANTVLSSLEAAAAGLSWAPIRNAITEILGKAPNQIEGELQQLRDSVIERSRRFFDNAASLRGFGRDTFQIADPTLRLIRAFGEPPRVPKLDFDRNQIAYFFNEALPHVDITPVAALATQAASLGERLKPLGVRLPTNQTIEQLLPVSLEKFDLSRIFPNFAGLDLGNLFSGLKLTNIGKDNIKITHGLDEQTRRAFLRADVTFHISEEATLFNLGPLTLKLTGADFQATSIVEAGLWQEVRRKVYGSIKGNWELVLNGVALLKFRNTELRFDDANGIKFSIDPRGIELPEILSFLSDLVSAIGGDGQKGLSIGLLPNGVQSVLSLPLPDMQVGAFGISNLRLCAVFALQFDDEFSITLGFGLARREAPFSLTIFILGGGGFFTVSATYKTRSRKLTCGVDVGITASASLAIALGPIKGGVYVYFGITATYETGSGFSLGVMLLMRGEVSVLGIVSASVSLLLDASYNPETREITGRGRLSISIKICWCFTLEIETELTYTLGKSSRKEAYLPAPDGASSVPAIIDAAWKPSEMGSGTAPPPADIFDEIAAAYLKLLV